MRAENVVQEGGGFSSRRKHHLSYERFGSALCGAEPRMSLRWNVNGDRAEFERLAPERVCKRCRTAETAQDQ